MSISKFRNRVELVRALAVALGLDPDKVPITRVAIEASMRDVARATVTFVVDADQDNAISEVIRTHEFKDEPESTTTHRPVDTSKLIEQLKSWRDNPLL